ncbi:MAG: hypothetical protein AAGA56_15170, partial [Myxococcota bacterium]
MSEQGLSFLDVVYRLDLPEDDWLDELAKVIEPYLGADLGSMAISYVVEPDAVRLEKIVMHPGIVTPDEVRAAVASAPAESFRAAFLNGAPCTTTSSSLGNSHEAGHVQDALGHHDIRDLVYLNASDGYARGLFVGCPLSAPRG